MSERLFCLINQQFCGDSELGDGRGDYGVCPSALKFLKNVVESLPGAKDLRVEDRGDTLVVSYSRKGEEREIMEIKRGQACGLILPDLIRRAIFNYGFGFNYNLCYIRFIFI